jgi:hypothetical protein
LIYEKTGGRKSRDTVFKQKSLLIILQGVFEFFKLICLGHHASTVHKTNHVFYLGFSVCFETDQFVSVVSILIRNTETNRNKPKKLFTGIGFVKQTEKQPKQVEFRFVAVRTENLFCLFRGHPSQIVYFRRPDDTKPISALSLILPTK